MIRALNRPDTDGWRGRWHGAAGHEWVPAVCPGKQAFEQRLLHRWHPVLKGALILGDHIQDRFIMKRTAGTYVTPTTLGESVQAFVPHPLPPAAPAVGNPSRPEASPKGSRHDTAGGTRSRPKRSGYGDATGGFRLSGGQNDSPVEARGLSSRCASPPNSPAASSSVSPWPVPW